MNLKFPLDEKATLGAIRNALSEERLFDKGGKYGHLFLRKDQPDDAVVIEAPSMEGTVTIKVEGTHGIRTTFSTMRKLHLFSRKRQTLTFSIKVTYTDEAKKTRISSNVREVLDKTMNHLETYGMSLPLLSAMDPLGRPRRPREGR